jgi:hypothetical protein
MADSRKVVMNQSLRVKKTMRSTSTLLQAMGLSSSFSGRSPSFFLTLLPIWHSWYFLLQLPHPLLGWAKLGFVSVSLPCVLSLGVVGMYDTTALPSF